MTSPLQIVDGSKSARFDGLILDISGLNGSPDVKRIALTNLEKIGIDASGDEWLFLVKAKNGGFSLLISQQKKAEWEGLVEAVLAAQKVLPMA